MATSHYCHGKWRSGSVGSCPRHDKVAKKQPNVYRGVGEPGGRSEAPKPPSPSKSKPKTKPSSGSTGAKSSDS